MWYYSGDESINGWSEETYDGGLLPGSVNISFITILMCKLWVQWRPHRISHILLTHDYILLSKKELFGFTLIDIQHKSWKTSLCFHIYLPCNYTQTNYNSLARISGFFSHIFILNLFSNFFFKSSALIGLNLSIGTFIIFGTAFSEYISCDWPDRSCEIDSWLWAFFWENAFLVSKEGSLKSGFNFFYSEPELTCLNILNGEGGTFQKDCWQS